MLGKSGKIFKAALALAMVLCMLMPAQLAAFADEAGSTEQETAEEIIYSFSSLSGESGADGVLLRWSFSAQADCFEIYRSTADSAEPVLIGISTEEQYLDSQIAQGQACTYVIVAVIGSDEEAQRITSESIEVIYSYVVPGVKVKKLTRKYPDSSKFTLAVKQYRTIKVTVSPSKAENKTLKWKSADKSVATVNSSGKVTAKGVGKTTITATTTDSSNISLKYTVTVKPRKKGDNYSMKKVDIVSTDTAKYTYAQMQQDIKDIKARYPEIIRYKTYGKSADNRRIYRLIVGNPNAPKRVVIQAAMHGREYINSLLVMRQVEMICANYYSGTYNGKYYSEIFDKVCLWVVPMTNPDGVTMPARRFGH